MRHPIEPAALLGKIAVDSSIPIPPANSSSALMVLSLSSAHQYTNAMHQRMLHSSGTRLSSTHIRPEIPQNRPASGVRSMHIIGTTVSLVLSLLPAPHCRADTPYQCCVSNTTATSKHSTKTWSSQSVTQTQYSTCKLSSPRHLAMRSACIPRYESN